MPRWKRTASSRFCLRRRLMPRRKIFLFNMRSVFPGGTYNSAINNCTTAEELQQLMDKFMDRFSQAWSIDTDKASEIIQLTKTNSWKPVTTTVTSSEITLAQGETKTFNIAPTFKDEDGNTKTITTDRISYKSSNTSLVNVDQAGNVTVTGANAGTFTVTVAVLVDGVEVGKIPPNHNRGITVARVDGSASWVSLNTYRSGSSFESRMEKIDQL